MYIYIYTHIHIYMYTYKNTHIYIYPGLIMAACAANIVDPVKAREVVLVGFFRKSFIL